MKTRYKILLLSGLLALFAWSCKTDELITFEGGITYIHFYREGRGVDSLIYNFARRDPYAPFVYLERQVRIAGDVMDIDRPIAAELVDTLSTAVLNEDIVIIPSYIMAGQARGWLRIRVYNTERIRESRTLATIRLKENEHFRNDMTFVENQAGVPTRVDAVRFRFFVENVIGMPNLWAEHLYSFTLMFGEFSIAKYELMMELIGFDRDFLNFLPEETLEEASLRTGVPDLGIMGSWARTMNYFLNAYLEANGREMVDEHGDPIRMGRTGQNMT